MKKDIDYEKEYKKIIIKNKEKKALQKYMQTLLDSLADVIIIAGVYEDEKYLIKDCNQSGYELLGYTEEELIGMDLRSLIKEGLDEVFLMEGFHNEKIKNIEKTYIAKNKIEIPVLFSVSQIENENQEIKEIICVAQDLRIQKQNEKRLLEYATIDKMTGTFNRGTGIKKLKREMESRSKENPLTISFIDVNDLKKTNDLLGHRAGDDLIIGIVQAIFKMLDKNDFIFRLGGDEFVLVFINKDMDNAEKEMQKILKEIENLNSQNKENFKYSISYGLKEDSLGDYTIDHYIELADKEMYKMKQRIKGRENICSKSRIRTK